MPHITSPAIHEIIGANHTLGALAGLADRVVMTDPTGNGLASRRASNDPTDPGGIVARSALGRIKAVAGVAADDVVNMGQLPVSGALYRSVFTEEIAIGVGATVVSVNGFTIPQAVLTAAVDKTLHMRVWGGRSNQGGVGGGCPRIRVGGVDYDLGNPAAVGENWHRDATREYETANMLHIYVSQLKYDVNYMSYMWFAGPAGNLFAAVGTLVNTGANWWNNGDLTVKFRFADRTGVACSWRFTAMAEVMI